MDIRLDNRVALVTGAGTGIGRAIAVELARAGAAVAVNYHSSEAGAREALREITALGARGLLVRADVTRPAEIEQMVADVAARLGDIGILVNNAGGLVGRVRVEEMTEEFYSRVMDVNVKSAFLVTRAVIPGIRRAGGGRIVNLASLAAHNGGGNGTVAYAAAKAALLGFTRGLAKELAPLGCTVNAVAPGLIDDTPFHATFTAPEAFQAMKASIPVGRAGVPADVARAVCYLVSAEAGFISGECLEINGGAWMR